MSAEEIKAASQRWQVEAKEGRVDNPEKFMKWLVRRNYVTDYQAALLSQGRADDFFLGPYKILDRLGKGRMAVVYKAEHKNGAFVALKILPLSKSKDAQVLARFQREASLALRLNHPNVVRSHEVSAVDGLHFLVMEHLEGETLEETLARRRKLPCSEAARLIYLALLGLQHLHEQGLIHRDLKPGNLMLTPVSLKPDTTLRSTVKIVDIGLGRELLEDPNPAAAAEQLRLTDEGAIVGTPSYLAPEQALDARRSDIRADIYSLGCVLYHAVTGQAPFADKNALQQMIRNATEAPRPLRDFNPAAPPDLQKIVDVMLAKDPGNRYATPAEAGQALHAYLVANPPESDSTAKREKRVTQIAKPGALTGSAPALSPPAAPPVAPRPATPVQVPPAVSPPRRATPPPAVTAQAAKPTPSPPPVQVAPPAAVETTAPDKVEFDVELVPVDPPKAWLTLPILKWEFTGREILFLAIGIAIGIWVGVIVILLR